MASKRTLIMSAEHALPVWTAYDSSVLIEVLVAQRAMHGAKVCLSASMDSSASPIFLGIINTHAQRPPVVAWPADLRLEVNGVVTHPATHRLLRVSDDHYDLSASLTLDVVCSLKGNRDFPPHLIVFVARGLSITADDYCKTIRSISPPVQLCRRFNKGGAVAWNGGTGSSWAGRTTFCKHIKCFDLRAEIARVSPLLHMGVSCPICGAHALMCNLYVDTYVQAQVERDSAFQGWKSRLVSPATDGVTTNASQSRAARPAAPRVVHADDGLGVDVDAEVDRTLKTIWTMEECEFEGMNVDCKHTPRLRTPILYLCG